MGDHTSNVCGNGKGHSLPERSLIRKTSNEYLGVKNHDHIEMLPTGDFIISSTQQNFAEDSSLAGRARVSSHPATGRSAQPATSAVLRATTPRGTPAQRAVWPLPPRKSNGK